jgi:CO/xanthine dehydrogenase FAD-binding subunit
MRGNPESYDLIQGASLADALGRLSAEPGHWMPIAGGTELMVAHAAGRLNQYQLLSLSKIDDLNFIRVRDLWLSIGGGVTFGQIRRSAEIAESFPLLARAATWIGSIANQNRATIAGNIVNGSPAADAPPALLVYDAEIELISQAGSRRMPYSEFHVGYKQSMLRAQELVLAIHLPKRFQDHTQYLRKVGTRKAMAITKVALAATARVEQEVDRGVIVEVRIAAASVANRPTRLVGTETALIGRSITAETRESAKLALMNEVRPIDDIRSTAAYRRQVAANLLDEFLVRLQNQPSAGVLL